MLEWELREELCRVGREIHAREYVSANDGNFSYRLNEKEFLSTPTMISKGRMNPDDLVIIDVEGNKIAGHREPTSEVLMHMGIYRNRPEIKCVLHAHPPYATAHAVVQKPIPKCVSPEVELFIGEIPIVEYATTGSYGMADALEPYVQDFNVFLLANHGIVTVGETIQQAHWRMEITESYCRLLLLANQIGDVTYLNRMQMQDLFNLKERLGIPDRRLKKDEMQSCDFPAPAPKAGKYSGAVSSCGVSEHELVERITDAVMKRLETKPDNV